MTNYIDAIALQVAHRTLPNGQEECFCATVRARIPEWYNSGLVKLVESKIAQDFFEQDGNVTQVSVAILFPPTDFNVDTKGES